MRQKVGRVHDKIGKEKLDTRKSDDEMQCFFHAPVDGYLHQRQVDISRRDVPYEIGDKTYEEGEKYHCPKVMCRCANYKS
jgi:hypothetical protein